MKQFAGMCLLATMMSLAPGVRAHHSPAQFDLTRDAIVEGTIAEVSWRNPHVYFELNVTSADGGTTTRRIEAGPASNMAGLGFHADAVSVGDHVIVQVKPNRRGEDRTALGWLLTKADGSAIPLHVRAIPQTLPGEAKASSLAGSWIPQGTGFANLAVAARNWPLNETGRAAVEATHEARNASRSTCVPFGPPALMALPSLIEIKESDSEIVFSLDVMGAVRTVHLGLSEHPANLEPSLFGHSIGHYEGETLVVDTIAFAPHPDGYAFDRPSSGSKHIVERFTLTQDRKHVEYEAVINDPEYFSEPITHSSRWDYRPGQMPSNLPCDHTSAGAFVED